jgi:hypothetical protein
MKKNVLALSIAAMIGGFAGAASAQTFPNTGMKAADATALTQTDGGAGHILLVPYYNAQNSNMSVLHVVNTDTTNGKAIKVRFRGAANSDDVLDFTVFLSPGDVWTGAVTAEADGVAKFTTSDKSCTLPSSVKDGGVNFSTARLAKSDDVAGTKEGYIEILNMADIVKGQATVSTADVFATTKHKNGVAECDIDLLEKTLDIDPTNANSVQAAANLGFNTPSGGLTGDWYILNVAETTTFSGSATAIAANGRGNFVLFPQDNGNSAVTAGNVASLTADPLLKAGKVAPVNYDMPDLSTPYLTTTLTPEAQAIWLTAQVANNGVSNQYALDKIIDAKTDWVLSMPARRYSVGADYTATSSANLRVYNPGVVDAAGKPYFDSTNTYVKGGLICATTSSFTIYDREESSKKNSSIESPQVVAALDLCGEVNVTTFGTGKSMLGASVANTKLAVDAGFENGWAQVNYKRSLPVVGASFIKLSNTAASSGFSGTYGITWPHRSTK